MYFKMCLGKTDYWYFLDIYKTYTCTYQQTYYIAYALRTFILFFHKSVEKCFFLNKKLWFKTQQIKNYINMKNETNLKKIELLRST